KEAIRMGELVTDLLELARIDEAKPLQLTAVDLVPIAKDAALDAMAGQPDRVVTVVASEAPPPQTAPGVALDSPIVATPPEPAPATSSRPAALTTGPIAFAGATLARLRLMRSRQPKDPLPVPVELTTPTPPSTAIVPAEENKIR